MYLIFLESHSHHELKKLVEQNNKTSTSIKALLNSNMAQLESKLEAIENAMTVYASRIDGFTSIASCFNPGAMISEQCIHILKQMNETGASALLRVTTLSEGTSFMRIGGENGNIDIIEPRFLEDDLITLTTYGLLHHDYNNEGNDIYRITRIGASLAEQNNQ